MPRLMCSLLLFLLAGPALPQETYKKPPKEILDVLDAPVTPMAVVSPTWDTMLLAEPLRYPPIADLAQPMLRLAGLRINPATNGRHHPPRGATCSKASHRMPAGNGKRIQLKYKGPALASWP